MRTQNEILERYRGLVDDMFGWRAEVLTSVMEEETITAAGLVAGDLWAGPADPEQDGRDCLAFAINKIEGHWGISAERSVWKLAEYAWLLGRDDVAAAMDAAPYPQYGAPRVRVFAAGMGWEWPAGPELDRMSRGLPCSDGCGSGCGQ